MSKNIKKTWNPFKRDFWTKENLIDQQKMEEAKQHFQEAKVQNEKVKDNEQKGSSNKLSRIGSILTFLLTLPLLGLLLFNIIGFFVGLFIGILLVISTSKKNTYYR